MGSTYKPRKKLCNNRVIDKCAECDFIKGIDRCNHLKTLHQRSFGIDGEHTSTKIKWPCCVPKWCPLPDAPKKEGE